MNIYAFRSCYTGAVAGGDTHLQGFLLWVTKNSSNKASIIQPYDIQHTTINPVPGGVSLLSYKFPVIYKPYALVFIFRALIASLAVRISTKSETNTLIASSHFLPDVLPVTIRKWMRPNTKAITFIYHIVQESDRPIGFSNALANLQERMCFCLISRYFDGVIVDNKNVKLRLQTRGFNMPILASSNFIDASIISLVAQKKFSLTFCGRFVKQKGIYDFLDVVEQMQKSFPELEACMIGAGPELDNITSLVKSRGLRIKLPGYVSIEIKYKIIAQSKLFLFPSYEEGWGIVIAEALAAGVQVLAYDLPVYKEVFPGHIEVVERGNVAHLISRAKILLARPYDGDELVNFAKQFDINSVCKSELKFITKLRNTKNNEIS